jgi:hypothetical protein
MPARHTRDKPSSWGDGSISQARRIDDRATERAFREIVMLPKSHHLLLAGLLLFFVGMQFRLVESFTLNERSSRFVSAQLGDRGTPAQGLWQASPGGRMIHPPRWLGLALMSAGAVLTIKSLSMRGSA